MWAGDFNGAQPPVPCTVLDPFGGAGTTGLVADRLGRNAVLIELNPAYAEMARNRLRSDAGLFAAVV
jgi:adenine-specific DNA methylase